MDLFDLKGRVALVTGATHGLGMAMATGLGKAGATLVINGHSSQEKLDAAGNYLDQVRSVAGQLEAGRAEVEAYADRYQLLCFQFGLRFFKDLIGNIEKVIAEMSRIDMLDERLGARLRQGK